MHPEQELLTMPGSSRSGLILTESHPTVREKGRWFGSRKQGNRVGVFTLSHTGQQKLGLSSPIDPKAFLV